MFILTSLRKTTMSELTPEKVQTWIKVIHKLDEVNEEMRLLKEELAAEQVAWDAFMARKAADDEERRLARAARNEELRQERIVRHRAYMDKLRNS